MKPIPLMAKSHPKTLAKAFHNDGFLFFSSFFQAFSNNVPNLSDSWYFNGSYMSSSVRSFLKPLTNNGNVQLGYVFENC